MNVFVSKNSEKYSVWNYALRWIAVLPAAYFGATFASSAMLSEVRRMDPDFEIGVSWGTLFHAIWGAVFVGIGLFVAPAAKTVVAIILSGICVVAFGIPLIRSLQDHNWTDLIAPIAGIAASIGCAIAMVNGERKKVISWRSEQV